MTLSRREFLVRNGVAAAATMLPGGLLAAVEAATPAMPALGSWDRVREQFALTPEYRHFASFYLASHPRPVAQAIEGFRKALDANPLLAVEHGMFSGPEQNLQRRVQQEIGAYLGARPEDIALVGNTTTALALVYNGLPLSPGDEILTTVHDHYSHHESIRYASERTGATVRRIALFDEAAQATVDGIVSRIRDAIGARTRVVGVTWVHSSSGVRLPVREIAAMLKDLNGKRADRAQVRLVVDGVHGIGAVDEEIAAMGCDYFCAGTHKWMFAPRGTGIVWANAANWALLRPTVPSFSSWELHSAWMDGRAPSGPTTANRMSPGGFHAYEHQWAMGAAFAMHREIGRARVAERIASMNARCKAGLAQIKGVTLHTPGDRALSAGITCFEVEGLAPQAVVERLLDRRILASTTPYAVTYARLAPSLVNTPEEVDEAVAAVRAIAAA